MAKTIRIKNSLTDNSQFTLLSGASSTGGTAFPVRNINSFSANWAVQIGDTGRETTEVLVLGTATPSGTALQTAGSARFDHPTDTRVYAIKYDQIVFERSETGTAGVATAVATVNITPDSEYTDYFDPTGQDSYGYKAYYINSVLGTALVSAVSDWLTSDGFSFYSLAKIRERVRNKLFSANFLSGDAQINDWINEWVESLNNVAIDVNEDYGLGTADIYHGADGLGTITLKDFKEIRRVWYTTDGSNFYKARRMKSTDYSPDENFNETYPYFYYLGDNVLAKKPQGQVGSARIEYYKMRPVLVNDTDELPVVMRSYTKSFVDYGMAQASFLDGKIELADRYMGMAASEKDQFRVQIAPRHKTGPQFIRLTDVVDGDDNLEYF
jgi:hypothetical protein